jgi:RHS repeat-associated protein
MKSINKNRIGLMLLIVAGFGAAVLTTTGQSPTHTAGRGMNFTSQATPSVMQLPASNAKHKTSTHSKLAVKPATHHVVDSLSQPIPQVKRVMILSTQKAGIIGKYDGHQFDNPADNVFSISLERQPAPTDKVFLSYQLTGLSHYSGVSCSINDRLAMGGYLAKKSPETTLQRIQLNAQWLTQGDNRIQFSLPADADYGCKISDLSLEIEPSTATIPLVINSPTVLLNGKAYLHGFLTGQLANTASSIAIDGTIVKVHDGEFETIVSTKAQFPLSITAQGEGGTAYSTTVQFATNDVADHEYQLQKPGASLSQHFNVGQAATLGADNVLLKLTEQALKSTQPLSVTALRDVDLPALDMGMNNVTAGNQGYRFLPHGEHFNAGATVSLKYDRTKIPTGYTENDVRTYYFDNETHHWVALERDTVDKSLCMVVSKTTHFTDMINGIIKVPESPQTEGFAPTMMNDIKIADPASKIQVIAPPAPNNTGSANLNYHIEVPPARNGMAPDLNISYSSDGGSGWLGEGWNLNVSSITVDTRWGVPRYTNSSTPTSLNIIETETYNLDGVMLASTYFLNSSNRDSTLVAHSGAFETRFGDRQFYPRVETDFKKIIRKGKSPSTYYWEVTDKRGTKYTYGGSGAVLKGKSPITNDIVIAEWKLSKIQEIHGDYIKYYYTEATENGDLGSKSLYLSKIEAYTYDQTGVPRKHTQILFTNRNVEKSKKNINGRYGFLTSNNKLLENIDVYYQDTLLRTYTLGYKDGMFNTNLLQSVTHKDGAGISVGIHNFDYHDDARYNATTHKYENLFRNENWTIGKYESSPFINPLSNIAKYLNDSTLSKNGTAIGASETVAKGGNVYIGAGLFNADFSNQYTLGGNIGLSKATTQALSTLMDINGDGLPDYVYVEGGKIIFRAQTMTSYNSPPTFSNATEVKFQDNVGGEFKSVFSQSISNSTSSGVEGKLPMVSLGYDHVSTYTSTPVYFSDVNNDGLVDIVNYGRVLFNTTDMDNDGKVDVNSEGVVVPTFTYNSVHTRNPISNDKNVNATDFANPVLAKTSELSEMQSSTPLQDMVRVWEAPFAGTINISGAVKLLVPTKDTAGYYKADGVRVAIQTLNKENWSKSISKGDVNSYNPNLQNIPVALGQKIYFRVQCGNSLTSNGTFDNVTWNPTITYVNKEIPNATDIDGYNIRVYNASDGYVISKFGYNHIDTINSTIRISGKFIKPATSDAITLKAYLSNDRWIYHDSTQTQNPNYEPRKEVYSRTFSQSDVFDGDISFTIDNSLVKGQNFRFEVQSETNVCWERIKWSPIITYTQSGRDTSVTAGVKYCMYTNVIQDDKDFFIDDARLDEKITVSCPNSSISTDVILVLKTFTKSTKIKMHIPTKSPLEITLPDDQSSLNPTGVFSMEIYSNDTSFYHNNYGVLFKVRYFVKSSNPNSTYAPERLRRIKILCQRQDKDVNYGPMWRGWGQFEFNANKQDKTGNPIKEADLVLPLSKVDTVTKDMVIPAKQEDLSVNNMTFYPLAPDTPTKNKWMGINEHLQMNGDTIRCGRLNIKTAPEDIKQIVDATNGARRVRPVSTTTTTTTTTMTKAPVAPSATDATASNTLTEAPAMEKTDAPVLTSRSESNGLTVAIVGGAMGNSETLMAYMDMNGDGIPDVVRNDNTTDNPVREIQYSNCRGWKDSERQAVSDVNKSTSINIGLSIGGPAPQATSATTGSTSTENSSASGVLSATLAHTSLGIGASLNFDDLKATYMDINGDGLPDKVFKEGSGDDLKVSLNLGYSFATPTLWGAGDIQSGFTSSKSESLGMGFDVCNGSFKGGFGLAASNTNTLSTLMDVNGDGLPDLVKLDVTTNQLKSLDLSASNLVNPTSLIKQITDNMSLVRVAFNTGYGFTPFTDWGGKKISQSISTSESANMAFTISIPIVFINAKISTTVSAYASRSISKPNYEFRDVDGDGILDIVSATPGSNTIKVLRSTFGKTNKLKLVSTPLGGSYAIDYDHTVPTADHPHGKWVMKSLQCNDGISVDGPITKNTYEYSGGKHDRNEREFLGFAKLTTRNLDTEHSDAEYRITEQYFNTDNIYTKGILEKVVVMDANSVKQSMTTHNYYNFIVRNPNSNKRYYYAYNSFPMNKGFYAPKCMYTALQMTKEYLYQAGNEKLISYDDYKYHCYTPKEYPAKYGVYYFGEIRQHGHEEAKDTGKIQYVVLYDYTANPCSNYVVSLPTEVKVRSQDATITYKHIKGEYTDPIFLNHLTKLTEVLDNKSTLETIIKQDKFGNVIKKTLPSGMVYDITYDSLLNTYPTSVTDAHSYKSRMSNYDYRYGIARQITDINGQVERIATDNLGRITSYTGPNEIASGKPYTIKMEYFTNVQKKNDLITKPAYATTTHYDPANVNSNIMTASFADGFGRTVQVNKDAVINGNARVIVSGVNKYDALGRVVESYTPTDQDNRALTYFSTTLGEYKTTSTYDVLNRPLTIKQPNGATTSNVYSLESAQTGDDMEKYLIKVATTDPLNHIHRMFKNASGQTVRSVQVHDNDSLITRFDYDLIGQLKTVTDPAGQFTTYAYDSLGHQTEVTHPASGTTRYHFDKTGNMVSKVTAMKDSILYGYNYNRLETITYPRHPENNVKYVFGASTDASGFNRKGRLAYQEDGSGTQEFKYGRMGELEENIRTLVIPNQATATYTTKWKYDSWNRLMSMTYPDGEQLTYGYNTGGQLTSITGASPYLTDVQYDKFEQRTSMTYGNGAVTTYEYNDSTRNLKSLNVKANKQDLINNAYAYDKVNNIKTITGTKLNHTYGYDDLYRLTSADGTYRGAGNKYAHYDLRVGYDNMYNITSKSQHVRQYGMQYQDSLVVASDLKMNMAVNHQQIANIADTSYRRTAGEAPQPIIKKQDYTYDANGNLLTIISSTASGAGGSSRRGLLWDEENHLLGVNDNGYVSTYWYDASGERTVKQSGDALSMAVNGTLSGASTGTTNFTAYINPYTVINNGNQMSKHIYVGTQRIMSKLCDAGAMADPTTATKATYTGSTLKYADKYKALTNTVKARYDSLGVPYNGVDNNGATFYKASSSTPSGAGGSYYFHSDHLGSANYITDETGSVSQHLEYIPYGETFVDERYSTWHSPYKFNGKERDEETGLTYYSQRYFDGNVWYTRDPRQSEYPSTGSYVYCLANPTRFVDPDGRGSEDRVASAKSMTGIPYKQEQGSLRSSNSPAAKEFMDCSELVCRVMVADGITKSGTSFNSASMKDYLSNSDKFEHSSTPEKGDIAVWKGHVAVVTEVHENGKVDFVMARGKGKESKEFKSTSPEKLNKNTFYGYYHPINETPDGKVGNNSSANKSMYFNQAPEKSFGDKMMQSKMPIVNDLGRIVKSIGF